MHSPRLIYSARVLYLTGLVLALVGFVPGWPLALGKVAAFAVCLFLSSLLFVLGGGVPVLVRTRGFYLILLLALLPAVYIVSAHVSINPSVAWLGTSVESDTVLFVLLGFIASALAFALFKTPWQTRLLLRTVFLVLSFAALFQLAVIVCGAALPLGAFADHSVNLIGKWNDLGLMLGLLALFSLAWLEMRESRRLWRVVAALALLLVAVLLAIVNLDLVWILVLAFSVVLSLLAFIARPAGASRIPWYALAAAALCALMLFISIPGESGKTSLAQFVNTHLTTLFPLTTLEARPAMSTTATLASVAHGGHPMRLLLGTGPGTFVQEWLLHKPQEVNQTPFWNIDFRAGFSTLTTALVSVGILGVLAWLLPALLLLFALARALRHSTLALPQVPLALPAIGGSLYLWAVAAFYTPSQNILLLGFALSGAALGFLCAREAGPQEVPVPGRLARIFPLLCRASFAGGGIALVLIALWAAAASTRRFVSELLVGQGSVMLQAGDAEGALAAAARAHSFENTEDAALLAVEAGGVRLSQLVAATSSSELLRTEFQSTLARIGLTGSGALQEAMALNPADYRVALLLGHIYAYLDAPPLSVTGAYEFAQQEYLDAAAKDPTNPALSLALAQLFAAHGDRGQTQKYLSQALTQKSNYTDAILLAVQIYYNDHDVPSAIRAATAAAQSAPGYAPLWFELGYLYYYGGDTAGAIGPLEHAVSLAPGYADAKFYLGVSYYAQGRVEDAKSQFIDLQKTNPDNTLVQQALANLAQGKPPVSPAEKTKTAPVSQ